MKNNINDTPNHINNPLVIQPKDYCDREKITLVELAGRLGFTKIGWIAIFTGARDIRQLPVRDIRIMASILNITCLSALIMSTILNAEDLS